MRVLTSRHFSAFMAKQKQFFESIKGIWSALLLQLQLVFMLKETISNAINLIQPAQSETDSCLFHCWFHRDLEFLNSITWGGT